MRHSRIAILGTMLTAALVAIGCGGGAPSPQAPPAGTPAAAPETSAPAVAPVAEAPAQVAPAPAETRPTPAAPAAKPAAASPKPAGVPAEPVREEPPPQKAAEPILVTIPARTPLDLVMVDSIGSRTSKAGDGFRATIASDVVAEGHVVIPKGSTIRGVVTEAVPLGKIGGTAKLMVQFAGLVLPSGEELPVRSSLEQTGKSESGKDAATIGGAAAAGALLGRALSKDNKSKGTVLGALAGAAAGGAVASKTKGEEIEFPAGTGLTIETETPVEVRIAP